MCTRMIDSFRRLARFHTPNGRGSCRTGGVGLDRAQRHAPVGRRLPRHVPQPDRRALERYNRDVGLGIPIPNSPLTADLILKRYRRARGAFRAAFRRDQRGVRTATWCCSGISTTSRKAAKRAFRSSTYERAAAAGRLLMFPPYWMYQHEGLPPVSGDKYIVSTYLLF